MKPITEVAVGIVVAVEEGQLLCAMRGIIGRIKTESEAADAAAQALGVALDANHQSLTETIEFFGPDGIFT